MNPILNAFEIALRYRKALLHCVLLATVTTLGVALLIPNWYKSTVSVFPVDRSNLTSSLGSTASPLNTFSRFRRSFYGKYLSKSIGSIETDRCLAILKSKTVLRAVIQKFDLVRVYDIKEFPVENTIKELLKHVEFKVVLEGNIFITVYDQDPQRAADMANYFVEILNATHSSILAKSVQANQRLVDAYYQDNVKSLTAARNALKRVQQQSGIVALPDQTEAYIKAQGSLGGQLMAQQVQADMLRRTLSSDHPNVKAIEIQIEEMQKELSKMNAGFQRSSSEMNIFTPFNSGPDLQSEYERKYFDVEFQYNFLQNMTWLNEQAKSEAQRNAPAVVVLESAFPAERKSKPYRALIMLGGILVGGLSALSLTLMKDRWMKMKKQDPAYGEAVAGMAEKIASDFLPFRLFVNRFKGLSRSEG